MLTLFDIDRRTGRREFLKVGSLALGELTLPGLMTARAEGNVLRDNSVTLLSRGEK